MSDIVKVGVGIDPGSRSGSIAVIAQKRDGSRVLTGLRFRDQSEPVIAQWCREKFGDVRTFQVFCSIEKVHSYPNEGVTSAHSFGRSVGFCTGVMTALMIPLAEVSPKDWQREYAIPGKSHRMKPSDKEGKTSAEIEALRQSMQAKNRQARKEHKERLSEALHKRYPGMKFHKEEVDAYLLADFALKTHLV